MLCAMATVPAEDPQVYEMVSRADTVVIDWIANYWNHFSLWVQSVVT